jgi:GTP-binding protein
MGVLIENMRREGFELSISRPQVLFLREEDGQRLEPIEEVTIDVDDEYAGVVIEKLTGQRKGELVEMRPRRRQDPHRRPCPLARADRLSRRVPDRHARHGVLNRVFHGWAPWKGPIPGRAPAC